MAQIISFTINQLAGREKTISFDLNPDTNVFWGLNGSGKTSLLKILHSALTGDASNLLRVPFTSAQVTISQAGASFTRKIDRHQSARALRNEEPLLFETDDETLLSHEELTRRLRMQELELVERARRLEWVRTSTDRSRSRHPYLHHRYLPISRVSDHQRSGRTSTRSVTEMLDEATFDQLFAHQIQDIWGEYYSSSLVRIRSVQERGLAQVLSLVLGQSQQTTHEPDLDELEAYDVAKKFFEMQRLKFALKSKSAFVTKYQTEPLVRNIVAEIADVQKEVELAQQPQRKIEQLVSSLFAGGKQVELEGRNVEVTADTHTIPLESLSSGEKQMLRILLESVAARSSCIIIDEPELSMHVDWQHQLVECMRTVNPSAQIILATHSPEVMASLPDSAIFQL